MYLLNRTKTYLCIALLMCGLITFSSCKKKAEDNDIIIDKVIEKPQNEAKSCKKIDNNGKFPWIGNTYSYAIKVTPDNSLPKVENHEQTYIDNNIDLTIKRSDGSEFFSGRFTKNSFTGLLTREMRESGVLLNMKYEKSDADNAYFLVSVGSPDEMIDDFTVVELIITRMGATKLAAYNPSKQ